MRKTILLTGGAGFIGSHVNLLLNKKGYNTVILDDLSRGCKEAVIKGDYIEGDFADEKLLKNIFDKYEISGVIHFAAWTDVGESMKTPEIYYENNVVKTLYFLDILQKNNPVPVVFSSSAAVYGIPENDTVTEDSSKFPINPYGQTKLICEKILSDFSTAYGLRSVSLRYFNAAGGDPEGILKNNKPKESNLIPLVLRSLINNKEIFLFGNDYPTKDGTCVRDYIHVMDLASAHLLALEYLLKGGETEVFNLGTGNGYSVQEVVTMAEEVTGSKVQLNVQGRRAGDPPILMASAEKAFKKLNWHPKYSSLKQIISDAWTSYHYSSTSGE